MAVACPCQRSMISSDAMLQPSYPTTSMKPSEEIAALVSS